MKRLLIFLILILSFSFCSEKYFIIDSSLVQVEDGKKMILIDNIVDFFYYNNKPYFIQQTESGINILTLYKTRFLPLFPSKNKLQKIFQIKEESQYMGNFIKDQNIFVVFKNNIYIFEKMTKYKKIKLDTFTCVYYSDELIGLKKLKNGSENNAIFVYEVDKLINPLFTVESDNLLQILKGDDFFISLELSQIYQEDYTLKIRYISKDFSKDIFENNVKVFYNSVFYIILLDRNHLLLQTGENANIYNIDQNLNMKLVGSIESFYSYFANPYLFVINKNNLTVYYWTKSEIRPFFSIPNVSFIFYSNSKLYYLFYSKDMNVWVYNYLVIDKDFVFENNEELILYTLPEEVIPI